MSFGSDFTFAQYPSGGTTDSDSMREVTFFAPPPQDTDAPSPESFDRQIDNVERFGEFLFRDMSFEQVDGMSPNVCDADRTVPIPHESWSTSSNYSFDHSNPSEFETHGSVYSYRDRMQASISSPESSDHSQYISSLNPAEVHSTVDLGPNYHPDGYSTATQQPGSVTCVDPAALSVNMISDSTADMMAPIGKPFKCPVCPFFSARRHNLKTHVETHDKDASKRFECDICGNRLSRKHDLGRHRQTIHGEQMPPSSSMSSVTTRRFDQRPDIPQYHNTAVNGDERAMSSPYQGSFSATGLEGLVARWDDAAWLQRG